MLFHVEVHTYVYIHTYIFIMCVCGASYRRKFIGSVGLYWAWSLGPTPLEKPQVLSKLGFRGPLSLFGFRVYRVYRV